MESCFSLIFLLLTIFACMGHATAALLPKLYWESMLPNTIMPRTLKDLLQPEFLTTLKSHDGKLLYLQLQSVDNEYNKYGSSYPHHKNIASQFFLDKSLYVGTKLKLRFPKTSPTKSPFLIRKVADRYPFSSKQLPKILTEFSMKPKTIEANLIENTIRDCEAPSIKGEEKYCTTSLESMVDLVATKMGREVMALSTEVEEDTNLNYWQISSVVKKSPHNTALVCHKQTYPYAVFYCHLTKGLRVYEVGLLGAEGRRVNAIAVCHNDTSAWNPKHLAFQLLKVKPGAIPICHFLHQDDVLWV